MFVVTELIVSKIAKATHASVVGVEVVAVGDEDLDVLNEFALELGLDLDELSGDPCRLRCEFLPRVTQRVHPLHLLLRHRKVVSAQHRVRLLETLIRDFLNNFALIDFRCQMHCKHSHAAGNSD